MDIEVSLNVKFDECLSKDFRRKFCAILQYYFISGALRATQHPEAASIMRHGFVPRDGE